MGLFNGVEIWYNRLKSGASPLVSPEFFEWRDKGRFVPVADMEKISGRAAGGTRLYQRRFGR